jgi:tRNA threonylcarbamoyladenosine biosynthesis protein TsaB
VLESKLLGSIRKTEKIIMIKNCLIINCTGKNNSIGLKVDNNFFIHRFQTNIKNNDLLVNNILNLTKEKSVLIDEHFSVLVNLGPGSFSGIRASIAVAKGIKISKKVRIYGYKDNDLRSFDLKSIEFLIKENLIEKNLIKPIYIS